MSELDSQFEIFNEKKRENETLLEENTMANETITNLESQIKMLGRFLQPVKCHLSEKLPKLEYFNGDKPKLRS